MDKLSRRGFLKSSAMTTAAALVPAAAIPKPSTFEYDRSDFWRNQGPLGYGHKPIPKGLCKAPLNKTPIEVNGCKFFIPLLT